MKLFHDKTRCSTWEDLVQAFPDSEFQNVTRSSLPLLAYWMKQNLDSSAEYHFEYTVPSVAGARASHTDLMILRPGAVVGAEGKSTEPRYETVGEWRSKPGALRESALERWVELIAGTTGSRPSPIKLDMCVYQMVHPLASVCSVERPSKALTYQLFEVDGPHDWYRDDLLDLRKTFDLGDSVELRLHRIFTSLTPEGETLGESLPSLENSMRADAVRQALLEDRLFKFGEEETEVIT